MSDERPLKVITRRDLLKGAGLASAAAMAGHAGLPAEAEASAPMAQSPATVPARVVSVPHSRYDNQNHSLSLTMYPPPEGLKSQIFPTEFACSPCALSSSETLSLLKSLLV